MENTKHTESIEKLLSTGAEAMERKDYDVAVSCYEQAADIGSSDALARLGDVYNEGFARRRDTDKAFAYYKQAADAGNADGMYGLGNFYSCGYGVDTDGEKAVEWFEKAAAHGNSNAMIRLGNTYCGYEYDGGDERDEVADDSQEEKTGKKRVTIGNTYIYRDTDIQKAAEWYKKAIDAGNPKGAHALARIYDRVAFDSEEDRKTALQYYTKAANRGDIKAMQSLSRLYEDMETPDKNKSAFWLMKAAESGDRSAMYQVGDEYSYGKWPYGKNMAKAVEWYEKAADGGYKNAMKKLGGIYYHGYPEDGVPQDYAKAVFHYEKAARRGVTSAKIKMGDLCRLGRGTEQSDKAAADWYIRAARDGETDGIIRLANFYGQYAEELKCRIGEKRLAEYTELAKHLDIDNDLFLALKELGIAE